MKRFQVGRSLVVMAGLFSLAGCIDDSTDGLPAEPLDETPNAMRYGALGNSLTAGFINGGLIEGGQVASYPQLIAAQAGWNTPSLPILAAPGFGSADAQGIPQSAMYITKTGGIATDPVNPTTLLRNPFLPWPYDNLGIPGATTSDMFTATDATTSQSGGNVFFDLILRNFALHPGTHTPLDAMAARNTNALTLWIGNNDILGGALGGQPEVGVNITPPSVWETLFLQVADRVDAMDAKYVAVANVPNILDIPYVTTMPPRFPIGEKTTIGFNTEEENVQHVLMPFALFVASNPDTFTTFLEGLGTSVIPKHWTLTESEADAVVATASAYATIIERECSARGWAYTDAATELSALPKDPQDIRFDEINAFFPWYPQLENGQFSFIRNPRSAFSLDGVHPSEVGQGLIANTFIKALNDEYSLSIPEVDLDGLTNVVGFENAPTGEPLDRNFVPFDFEPARAAMENLPTLLGLGQ